MSNELKEILKHLNGEVSEETLLAYLNGTLRENEREQLEIEIAENPFLQDAIDGFRELNEIEKLPQIVSGLNTSLHHTLEKNKKERKGIPSQQWVIVAVVVLLLLCVLAWLVMSQLLI